MIQTLQSVVAIRRSMVRFHHGPLRSGSSNRTVLQVVATLLAFGRAFRKEKVEGESPSRCTSRGSRIGMYD